MMLFIPSPLKYLVAIRQIVLQEKANNESMPGLLSKLQLLTSSMTCTNDFAKAKNIKNKPEIMVCRSFFV